MTSQTLHLIPARHRDAAGKPTTTVASCGTILGSYYAKAKSTANETEVTCKRCLKTIETGSAATGILAGRGGR